MTPTAAASSAGAWEPDEEILRLAFDIADLGVFEWRPEADELRSSARCQEIFGQAPRAGAIRFERWLVQVHPDDRIAVSQAVRDALESGDEIHIEHRIVWEDGTERWVSMRARFDGEAPGDRSRVRGVLRDVTVRKSAELEREYVAARLAESNEELQRFAYIASHDLQEPVRKLQAYGERLEQHEAAQLSEKGRHYLGRIRGAADRMQRFLQDLLALSRISTRAEEPSPVELGQVVAEVLEDLELRIRETAAEISVDGLPTVEADGNQMHQLFLNLIGNALKYHRGEGAPRIAVRARREGSRRWRIEVEDDGIGFEEHFATEIFEPFRRLHGRSEYEGTGIGLAICKRIVERHGGRIEAQSRPGAGSTFIVWLSVAPGES